MAFYVNQYAIIWESSTCLSSRRLIHLIFMECRRKWPKHGCDIVLEMKTIVCFCVQWFRASTYLHFCWNSSCVSENNCFNPNTSLNLKCSGQNYIVNSHVSHNQHLEKNITCELALTGQEWGCVMMCNLKWSFDDTAYIMGD